VILKALKTKRAAEIVFHLLDVYTIFGAPVIYYFIHSDNGREFVNSIITELNAIWSDVTIGGRYMKTKALSKSRFHRTSQQRRKRYVELLGRQNKTVVIGPRDTIPKKSSTSFG